MTKNAASTHRGDEHLPSTINNAQADRINHHVAEIQREIRDSDLGVLEMADLGAMLDPFKDEINRRREASDLPECKLGLQVVTIEGISYRVRRGKDGSTVETPCMCFGQPQRTHNNPSCPWLAQREERIEEGRA